ncbi:MAG: hypothetical protein JNJ59_16245, partial [Deltaproteobacteria bacterium]|nr:hypothetical protein [Deltaproteobacteria bacterium]
MARTANPSSTSPRPARAPRSRVASLFAFALLLTAVPARASAPLPTPFVTAELASIADLTRGTSRDRRDPPSAARAYLRLLSLVDALDAVTPAAALAALGAIATPPDVAASRRSPADPAVVDLIDLIRARATLDKALRLDGPAPLALAEAALVAAVADPSGDLLGRHAALVARGAATHAVPETSLPPAEPELRWAPTARGPVGAIALDPFVPSASTAEGALLHVVVVFDVATPFHGALRLGATGDLVATLAPVPDPSRPASAIPLGEARALQHAVLDQLAAPLDLAPGRYALLVTLRPNRSEPALLRARLDPSGAVLPTVANEPSLVPRPVAVDAITWVTTPSAPRPLVDNPAVTALGDTFEATHLRRLLGLPDLAPSARAPHPPLEERLAKDLAKLSPTSLLLALSAVTKDEDRASLLLTARLAGPPSPLLLLAQAQTASERGQLVAARLSLDEAAAALAGPLRSPERPAPADAASDAGLADLARYVDARLARLAHTPEGALIAYGLAAPDLAVDQAAALAAGLSERDRVVLAQASLELGRADLAVALYDALVAESPGQIELQLALARAAEAAGLTDRAIALSRAAALRRPDRPALALEAARKLVARALPEDGAAARGLIDLALSGLAPRPDGRVMAARLLEALGDRPAAAKVLADVLVADPAHAEARRNLERLVGAERVPLTLTLDEV